MLEPGTEDERVAALEGIPCSAARKLKNRAPATANGEDPALERLKRDLLAIAKALPQDATAAEWDAAAWRDAVRGATDVAAVKEVLAALEGAVQPEFISPLFPLTPLLVRGAWLPTGDPVQIK